MTSLKSVKWTLGSGKSIECKIIATCETRNEIAYADGYNVDLGKKTYESINIEIYIDGKFYRNSYAPSITSDKRAIDMGCVSILANTVAIDQDIYNQITTAITGAKSEASQDIEYAALKVVEAAKVSEEIAKEVAEESNYTRQIKNGLCPKCGSYCYGDCGVE